jgi:adenylosuccinate lyase
MPHKRNPILTENLCGLARLVRSYAQACFENVALWHERDISHSSVERVAVPDACIALDFMLRRFNGVVKNLVVSPERMMENLELTRGTVFSGHLLLALVDKGISREDAYQLVQQHALAAWEGGATLQERVQGDPVVSKALSDEEISEVFSLKRHLREVDRILTRALV